MKKKNYENKHNIQNNSFNNVKGFLKKRKNNVEENRPFEMKDNDEVRKKIIGIKGTLERDLRKRLKKSVRMVKNYKNKNTQTNNFKLE